MSNLACYCSIAAVACIWYIDFLAPTLFGVPCQCNFTNNSSAMFSYSSGIGAITSNFEKISETFQPVARWQSCVPWRDPWDSGFNLFNPCHRDRLPKPPGRCWGANGTTCNPQLGHAKLLALGNFDIPKLQNRLPWGILAAFIFFSFPYSTTIAEIRPWSWAFLGASTFCWWDHGSCARGVEISQPHHPVGRIPSHPGPH